MRIKVNDIVEVNTGESRGERGVVLEVKHQSNRLIVEGINRVHKHVQRSQRNPQGGRLEKEMPIDISNVRLVCPECSSPTGVGYRWTTDNDKERFCKKCSASLGLVKSASTAPTEE
jgi:large subunit ribosomal protein L24